MLDKAETPAAKPIIAAAIISIASAIIITAAAPIAILAIKSAPNKYPIAANASIPTRRIAIVPASCNKAPLASGATLIVNVMLGNINARSLTAPAIIKITPTNTPRTTAIAPSLAATLRISFASNFIDCKTD